MKRPSNELWVVPLGRTPYHQCWDLQEGLSRRRQGGEVPDLLLMTEHDPVYTLGTAGSDSHLLKSEPDLRRQGIGVVRCNRGGDVTCHAPGQLVGYPIIDLHSFYLDLHRYLRDLEEVVIRAIAAFGIRAGRVGGLTGVWVEGEKICAIGIRTRRWVTMHGFALNVNNDLSLFRNIVPCGIRNRGVTSLAAQLGRPVAMGDVAASVTEEFAALFGLQAVPVTPAALQPQSA
ncbi:MAG: lipoyl(octanoyl) transferase LipB [Bacteroidota bacterium]